VTSSREVAVSRLKTVLIVVLLLGLVAALAVPAAADRDDNMVLGRANGAKKWHTSLYSTNNTATLSLFNKNGTGAPALRLHSNNGPALEITSGNRIVNLNSDWLDGWDSSAFAMYDHDHDTDYLAIDGTADDSDELDGLDSTAFALDSEVVPFTVAFFGEGGPAETAYSDDTFTVEVLCEHWPGPDGLVVLKASSTEDWQVDGGTPRAGGTSTVLFNTDVTADNKDFVIWSVSGSRDVIVIDISFITGEHEACLAVGTVTVAGNIPPPPS
jgi:hypothetical protein